MQREQSETASSRHYITVKTSLRKFKKMDGYAFYSFSEHTALKHLVYAFRNFSEHEIRKAFKDGKIRFILGRR